MKYFFLLLILLNTSVSAINLTAPEKEYLKNNTIKIGTEEWKPVVYLDKSKNELSGIIGDILNIGFKKQGIKTTIISDKWDVVLDKFKNNKVDLLPALYYTKDREKFANYSTKIFSLHEYLYIQKTSSIKNFEDLKNKKIAIIKSYAMINIVHKKYPSIEIIQTKNLKESIELVLQGKVEALIDGQLIVEDYISNNLVLGLKSIRQTSFKANDIYLITNKNKPILKSIFNKALASISSYERNEIAKKWLNIKDPLNFLTLKEKKYILKNKIIKMCNNPTWEPIEFAVNKNQSNMQGIAIDMINVIEKQLKINFINVPTKDWKESQEFLRDKKCDILPAAIQTKQRDDYANFTIPYLNLPLAIFTQKNKPLITNLNEIINTKTWSRKKGSGLINKIRNKYNNTKVVETKDNIEALRLVNNGTVDFTIATLPFASKAITKYQLNNLQISGYTNISFDLSIAIRNDKKTLLRILNKSLKEISQEQKQKIMEKWLYKKEKEPFDYKLLLQILFALSLIALFLLYKQYLLKKSNKLLKVTVKEKTKKLQHINNNLEKSIQEEIRKASIIEQRLYESEKMIAMGEMIGNIAHQWRQPLSVITTTATGLIFQKESGILKDDYLLKNLENINDSAQFLSKTIDDFKDLVKGEARIETFNLSDIVNKCLSIQNSTIISNKINIITNLDNQIILKSYPNALVQSLLNIFNNAKDALITNTHEKKYIFINTSVCRNKAVLEIYDNAGGIPTEIIKRIFEAYFTTKHKSQGTGLGLHMAYNMIKKNMDGTLCVENYEYIYENNSYTGAKFIIRIKV